MGESVSPWISSCNGSIRVELDGQRTTSDSGALLLREALDISGVIAALEDHLVDQRDPNRVRHSLASQLRTVVLQRAMGWIDLSDTDTLRGDPLWQLACNDARGTTPLAQHRLSQATLSRLLTCLGHDDNIDAVHEGLLRLVVWRLTSLKNGECSQQLTLDIDGLPIEVHFTSMHRSKAFKRKILEWMSHRVHLIYLSAYSPELNLIEILWRQIKYYWLPLGAYLSFDRLCAEVHRLLGNYGTGRTINYA